MERDSLVFTAIVVEEDDGFSSLCLDLDVASQGDTPAEAKAALEEAVVLYLETALEEQLPWLRPVPPSADPRFGAPATVVETYTLRVGLHVQVYA